MEDDNNNNNVESTQDKHASDEDGDTNFASPIMSS